MNLVIGKICGSGLKVVLVPTLVGGADAADLAGRHAALVLLLIDVPVAADFDFAPFGEEIDHGDADAVQTAGGLVGPLAELAAELEHGHHALQRGEAQVGMRLDGNAAAVVLDGHRAVVVDRDRDLAWRSRPSPRRSSCRRLRRPGGAGRAASVSPMYMLGRSRTCSRSLRCSSCSAPYSASTLRYSGTGARRLGRSGLGLDSPAQIRSAVSGLAFSDFVGHASALSRGHA